MPLFTYMKFSSFLLNVICHSHVGHHQCETHLIVSCNVMIVASEFVAAVELSWFTTYCGHLSAIILKYLNDCIQFMHMSIASLLIKSISVHE